uniref:Uncharacterized protein n=1 Tax=Salix viminalis TaxID=40686 RepID=A0A6N2KNX2_SALVM
MTLINCLGKVGRIHPDYECLRAELRKMAPPNGRAILLFRAKCGCPVAKLEGWGLKRGRRHKKTSMSVELCGSSKFTMNETDSYAKSFSIASGSDTAMSEISKLYYWMQIDLSVDEWRALANVAANGGDHR